LVESSRANLLLGPASWCSSRAARIGWRSYLELLRACPRLAVRVESCDLSDPTAVEEMLAALAADVSPIDVVVNNAGLGDLALYDRAEWSRIEQMLHVNVVAPALLTHRLLRGMVRRGRGGVLNLGSGAGFAIMPGSASYVGTKHFINGFTETLRAELEGTGVVVTQVCPGPVETEFDQAAGTEGLVGGPPNFVRISAEQCAREAIAGFERGRALVFPGAGFRLSMHALAIVPRKLERLAARPVTRRLRRSTDGGTR
jgi:short-subunit dehydrogenase